MKLCNTFLKSGLKWKGVLAAVSILLVAVTSNTLVFADASGAALGSGAPLRLGLTNGRTATLYLPEIDTQSGTEITARSAVSVTVSKGSPVFGAVRFTSQAAVDGKGEKAVLSQIRVDEVKLPDKAGDGAAMESALNAALQGVVWTMDAKRISQETSATAAGNASAFSTKPPKIYYEEIPSVLVFIDGDPILKPTKDGQYKYVENTAYFIVYSPKDKGYYLKGGKWWYRSTEIRKNWIQVSAPPDAVLQLSSTVFNAQDQEADSNIQDLSAPPKIIISTEPAELVIVNGAPQFTSVEGTSLLYVDNTENNIVLDVNTQKYYLLLAGRWYSSSSLSKGPWTFVPPDKLPGDFAAIPQDSGAADVRASVPGTSEAEEARLDAAVPEVAAVDRASATVAVSYDGTPSFVTIAGTKVRYAANANVTVLQINGRFYVVDKGIWFESALPVGPWVVAVSVPPEVQDIPPSSPVYNVRYVYIYDYTPDVVYVGYTPGYYCSYVHGGVVVYGTGYYYRPWVGHVYYAYPVTFGFGVHYNPYTGLWGYPVGVSFGWIGFGLAVAPFGFWGPAGYMYGYRHGYHHRYRHGYYHGYHNGYRAGYTAGRVSGYRASSHGRPQAPSLYADRGKSVRTISDRRQTLSSGRYSRIDGNRTKQGDGRFQSQRGQSQPLSRSENRGRYGSARNPEMKNGRTPTAKGDRSSPTASKPSVGFQSKPSSKPSAGFQSKPSSKQGIQSSGRSSVRTDRTPAQTQPYRHVVRPSAQTAPAKRPSPQKTKEAQTWSKPQKTERDSGNKPQKNSFFTSPKKEPSSSGFRNNGRSGERSPSYRSSAPPHRSSAPPHRSSGPSNSGGGRKRR